MFRRIRLRYIIIILLFFILSAGSTLIVKGNKLLAMDRLREIGYEEGLRSNLRIKVRNFLLYSKLSQLSLLLLNGQDYQIRQQGEEMITEFITGQQFLKILSREKRDVIKELGYKGGRLYYNLTPTIYKLDTFEQFFLIESLVRVAGRLPEVEEVKFLVNDYKRKISPYIDITLPIKVRKNAAQVAIIIDDFGNRAEGTTQILQLKEKITCAIMPLKEDSTEEGEKAKEAGFDVIIHLSMESEQGKLSWLGSEPILTTLSDEEIKRRMKKAIADLPQAIGFNNHTGSKVTSDRRAMKAVLEVAKENNLIAIDSKTTPKSVVREIAQKLEVPVLERDVFLDHQKDYGYIRKAILSLTGQAIKEGEAIGIGHVGPHGGNVTILALKKIIPTLSEVGIKFVGVSDLVNKY